MDVKIVFKKGSVANDNADVLINTVNCVGIMGAGVAKVYKEKYPDMFKEYRKLCLDKKMCIGKLFTYITRVGDQTKYIVNFPTKLDWKNKSKLEYIEYGLEELSELLLNLKPSSIAMPSIGCGNGGLDWKKVYPLIKQYLVDNRRVLSGKEMTIYIYIPYKANISDYE